MSDKLTSPGIAISETTGEVSTIRGQDTGIVYVLGVAEKGPIGTPIEILSPTDAEKKIGAYVSGYYGRRAVDVAFAEGATKVYFARTCHYTAGVADAVKATYTTQGYNPNDDDRAKVNTLKATAKSEGAWGNKVKIDTVKASTTSDANLLTGAEKVSVVSAADFEAGDIVEIDDAVHYARVVVTKVDTGANDLYFQALTLGTTIGSGATVRTCSTHKARTTLLTGTSVATGATYADLTNATGINVGAVVTFMDNRTGGGLPNDVSVKVTSISVNRIFFAALGAITTIDAANSDVATQEFDLAVYVDTVQVETFSYLSMSSANEKDYVENKVSSDYVDLADQSSTENDLGDIPETQVLTPLASGADGLGSIADADYIGSEAYGNGVWQFESEPDRFAQLICPDASSAAVQNAMLVYAERRRLWYEAWVPFDKTAAEAKTFRTTTAAFNSNFGGITWPNMYWINPSTSVRELIPVCAFIAGLNAREWSKVGQGPWTQPAGTEEGKFRTAQGLEGVDNNGKHETDKRSVRNALYQAGVNPLYKHPRLGKAIMYGIRTLEIDGDFPQKGERVTFLYCEHSIKEGSHWSVFKNINSRMKGRVRRSIRTFLKGIWTQGGLKGATAEEAFVIDLDSLNTAATEALGEFYGKIGLATLKGAEFVYFVFSKIIPATE